MYLDSRTPERVSPFSERRAYQSRKELETAFIRDSYRGVKNVSNALGAASFLLLTFGHDGGTEPAAEVFGKFVKLGVTVDFDGLLGRVANHVAVVAPGKMVLQLDLGLFVEDAVQVIRQLVQELRAFHRLPSPLSRFWK